MSAGKHRNKKTVGKSPFTCTKSRHKQLEDRKAFVQRQMKRDMKSKGLIEDKGPVPWEWKYGDECGTVFALTRSEARGEIKKLLGIPKKKRLPLGTELRKVELDVPFT